MGGWVTSHSASPVVVFGAAEEVRSRDREVAMHAVLVDVLAKALRGPKDHPGVQGFALALLDPVLGVSAAVETGLAEERNHWKGIAAELVGGVRDLAATQRAAELVLAVGASGPVDDAVEDVSAVLAGSLPESLAGAGGHAFRSGALDALAVEARELLVAMEAGHWSTEGAVKVLRQLARFVDGRTPGRFDRFVGP